MKEGKKGDNVIAKKAPVKGFRKLLQPLQVSATDKENLVGAGRSAVKNVLEKPTTSSASAANELPKESKEVTKTKIVVEDLTADTPSENYWELKCKKLTKALEETLEENKALHERIKLLEEENALCKSQLHETADIITVLTEIINEEKGGSEES